MLCELSTCTGFTTLNTLNNTFQLCVIRTSHLLFQPYMKPLPRPPPHNLSWSQPLEGLESPKCVQLRPQPTAVSVERPGAQGLKGTLSLVCECSWSHSSYDSQPSHLSSTHTRKCTNFTTITIIIQNDP